ncbi:GTA-gp10 family protein [Agrobacterium pusense]|uniref:GTA-gp10 family protein n=1 Tax=Agrobacterium pusense TaxID=648995 RepID=UPI003C7E057F
MNHSLSVCKIAGEWRQLRLTLGAAFSIDESIPDGMDALIERVRTGSFMMREFRVVAANLLVGGGMSHADAQRCIAASSLREVAKICLSILICCLSQDEGQSQPAVTEPVDSSRLKDRAAEIYSLAFQIGLKPHEVRNMTVWEWSRCVEGWNRAHGRGDELKAPARSELDDLVAKYS